MKTAIVTGASSGLGYYIARNLHRQGFSVQAVAKDFHPMAELPCDKQRCHRVDLADPEEIYEFCSGYRKDWVLQSYTKEDEFILINCAGINEINWIEDLSLEKFDEIMNVNARSIFLMTKWLLPVLKKTKGSILNIISNASHMPMTASLAYNASKGAAHIMTLQMARELTKKHGITVFGISPNKMAGTEMSQYIESRVPEVRGWTPEQAAAYQQSSLLAGETDPEVLADFVGYLLQSKRNHKHLSGCIIPYGA